MYDTIIIGSGAAGMTAGIYAVRRKMKTLIIGRQVGGQIIWASTIENYPGFKSVGSFELIQKMQDQVKSLGVEMKTEEVEKVIKDGDSFSVITDQERYQGKTIIMAMGLSPRRLNIPGEKELTGRGVSYCANCDGPLFKNKVVAVVGGGNAALDAAEVLSKIAKKVYLIYRRSKFKGFEILADKVNKKNNIDIRLDSEIIEILGSQKLEKLKVTNTIEQTVTELRVDGLFIEIGHEPKTDMVAGLVARDSKGQIVVDLSGKTSLNGVFAAGDITQNEFKQIIISCGQGAVAALSAYKYLQTKK